MEPPRVIPKAHILLSVLGGDQERIPIYSDPFTIGRAKTCNYSIPSKIVSGQHCKLSFNEGTESFHLEDTSTNGMLINKKTRTSKGKKFPLTDGDEVFLVYRKQSDSQTDVISFKFEQVQRKAETETEPEEITDNNNEEEDLTQEYFTPLIEGPEEQDDKKRKRDDDQIVSSQQPKRPHLAPAVEPIAKSPPDPLDSAVTDPALARADMTGAQTQAAIAAMLAPQGSNSQVSGRGNTHCVGNVGAGTSNPGKVECGTSGDDKTDAGEADRGPITTGDGVEEEDSQDEMMETLICSICQDILHDCVSLQPCLHTFCAACYTQWMAKSSRCPTCRKHVKRISKNHIVNNLTEAYLRTHPEKRRSEEEIMEMDARNKIKSDTVVNPKHDEEDYSDISDEDELDSSADMDSSSPFGLDYPPPFLGMLRDVFAPPRLPVMSCKQCPSHHPSLATPAVTVTPGSTSSVPGASTSTTANPAVPLPVAPPFVCPPGASHLMCKCCQQRFPDRRREPAHSSLPPVQCCMCQMFYCHMYWRCTSTRPGGCLGCLNKLKDLDFGDKCTDLLILGNSQESSIFKKYLQQKNLTWKSVFSKCLEKLESGEFWSILTSSSHVTKDSIVCYTCGLKVFKDLAYQYRDKLPRDQLPAEAATRPDCHWGRNCRTQFNKPSHAGRYNHVCPQTKF